MLENRGDNNDKIQLSDHFTYKMLLRFVLPSIIMMVFTSIYGVVDGLFVSNFVGKTPFAAVNLVMPFIMVFGGIGFMFGTGGSALVAKTMGEGDKHRANQYFTMMIAATLICGVIISTLGVIFMEPISVFLGADAEMLPAIVGANGVESDVPINLNGEEALKLKESADALKKIIEKIEL